MGRAQMILAAVVTLTACDTSLGIGPVEQQVLRHRLEQAEHRWDANGPDSYVLTLRRICYCATTEPRQVTVSHGIVTDVRVVGADEALPTEQWQWYPSVEGLFDIVREAIEMPAYSLEPLYDGDFGHPIRVAIDWDEMVADEEVTFEVMSLVGFSGPVYLGR